MLQRFRDALGCGGIVGPYRGRLFHWTTKRIDSVEATCLALWADLSPERREQFARAFGGSERWEQFGRGLAAHFSRGNSRMRELAWAAGLFDAEGSISRSRYPRLELAQASQMGQPHRSAMWHSAAQTHR
ncbi:MAG: hypothetical protein H0V71_03065 [Chloroflexi bacterium]|nr:hypothetical protein [Chloroflexota bacterium]